jgi:hypothetical protein
MNWLTGYYDATGHPDGKHALAVGGYVSSVPAWRRFESAWRRVLDSAGIETFHMADFMACAGEFRSWRGRESEQSTLLLRLAKVTKRHVRRSFSEMLILDAWKDVNLTYALKESRCTPYAICGFFVIHKTMMWLAGRERPCMARFFFEDGDKHKGDFIWFMDEVVRLNKNIFQGVRPHFEPKTVAPLQAADFVMWEQFNLAKDRLKNPENPAAVRECFQELMTIPKDWGFIDKTMLLKFCADWQIPRRGHSGRKWSPIISRRKRLS